MSYTEGTYEGWRLRNQQRLKNATERFCYDVEDLMDGYVVHTWSCPLFGDTVMSSTAHCVDFHRGFRSHGEVEALIATTPTSG